MNKKTKILNLGCGSDRYGTDFVDIYPSRKEVIKCDIDSKSLPYLNNTFDEIKFAGVIEHLRNPGFVMSEIYRVLKNGGKLSLETDNANYWGWSVGRTHLGGYEESFEKKGQSENRHYSLFTEWHLKNHAKKAGFRYIKIEYSFGIIPLSNAREFLRRLIGVILSTTPLYRMGYRIIKMEAWK